MTHLHTHTYVQVAGMGRVTEDNGVLMDGEHISGRKSVVSLDVERLKR